MSAGVYFHIPFCKSRCSYCDFATDVYRSSEAVDRYVAALFKEISAFAQTGGNATRGHREGVPSGVAAARERSVGSNGGTLVHTRVSARTLEAHSAIDTIYFGGGTPSLLQPEQIERILAALNDEFEVDSGAEITMEMNPATVTPGSLRAYRELGVNRASFGVQTFDDRALKLLARGHDANDARATYKMLRRAGYENISFDLIAGLPGQTLNDWKRNLSDAIALSPEHLSLYLLEIHEGTPLAEQVRSHRQPKPDEDIAAEMYTVMCDRLVAAGYEQYEISNFARPGFESRHNIKYWRLDPVYGFGVSAHSFDGRERYANERETTRYLQRIEKDGSAEVFRETVDKVSEYIFLGLRMNSGIDYKDLTERFDTSLDSRYRTAIEELRDQGLIEVTSENIRLTARGRLFSNEVFQRFI
jgi:oxygen-independent coproporphyrinogen-3 oxidase